MDWHSRRPRQKSRHAKQAASANPADGPRQTWFETWQVFSPFPFDLYSLHYSMEGKPTRWLGRFHR